MLAVHFASIIGQHHLPMDHLDLERKEVLGLIEEQSEFVMRGTICPLEYPAEGSNLFQQKLYPS